MPLRSSWLLVACAALAAALAGAWIARDMGRPGPRLLSGTWLPRPRSLGTISLVDQSGAAFTQARLRGAPALLYFGFTHCPDTCPTTLATLARVSRANVVPGLRVIFVTVDPARDTPPVLAGYVHAFDPHFMALTGPAPAIDAFAARLGIAFQRIDLPGGDYTIDHTAALFLLDAQARVVAIFTAPFDAARLEQDLGRAASFLAAGLAPHQSS
ncbi:MAG: SCO family protein [Steroidobacteraceae bacterium]